MVFAWLGEKWCGCKPISLNISYSIPVLHFSMDVYKIYLNFRAWAGVSFTIVASSGMEIVDLDVCSASDVGKLRPNDDRRGSAEIFVVLLLLLGLCPPPRSTCKWASRRSRLSKERAWLPGITNLRNRRRFCRRSEGEWVSMEEEICKLTSYIFIYINWWAHEPWITCAQCEDTLNKYPCCIVIWLTISLVTISEQTGQAWNGQWKNQGKKATSNMSHNYGIKATASLRWVSSMLLAIAYKKFFGENR